MEKRWKKRVAGIVLVVAMIVTQIGIWNASGTQVNAATGSWVDTTLVTNGDFETNDTTGWEFEMPSKDDDDNGYAVKTDSWASNNKSNFINIWSKTQNVSFSMTQKISDVAAGTYRLAFDQEGSGDPKKDKVTTSGLKISVNDIQLTQSATTGWDNWVTVTTDKFILSETGTITITISGNINAGYWGDFDNFVIQKYTEEGQATTVTSFIDDFNDNKTEGWTTDWSSSAGTFEAKFKDSPFGTSALNIYSKTAQKLTASYTVSNLEAGTYAVSMKNAGGDLTATVTASGDGVSETTKTLTFGAWISPATNKTSSFAVSKTTDLTIKIAVDFQAGGWGWIDDVELVPSTGGTTADDKYEVSINPTVDSVEVGESVTLTATVTKNGAAVTNLEGSGVHLYWWTTDDSQMGWLANRDENGYLFTVEVKPTEVGSCEINAEIKDDGDSQIAIDKKTLQATACATAVSGDLDITKVADLSNDFIMGMDISSVISLFDSGVTFKDEQGNTIDNVTDFCKLLAANGITHIRVRVWNHPYDANGNGYGGGNNDVAKAKLIADGCRAAGIKMLVDFHCSDLWTDPGKQQAPKAWKNYTLEQKKDALKAFITNSLNTIDAQKNTVAMVQVGNETTTGFIGETNVSNMCTLFSAGIDGVKAYNSAVKTVIHVTNPEKGNVTKWAANLKTYNVDYDIIATSYYPYWHGTLDNLKSEFKKVKSTYGKDVMVAETSYAYTLNDSDGHDNTVRVGNNDTGGYITEPFNEQGQATAIRNLIAAVNEVGGLGVYYWEPAWLTVGDTTGLTGDEYAQQKATNKEKWETYGSGWASSYAAEYDAEDAGKWYGGAAVDNEAMFYPDGRPTPALHVWNYVKTGATADGVFLNSVGTDEELNQTIKIGEQYSMPENVTVNYSNGDKAEAVVWNSGDIAKINASKAGEYKVSGIVTFTENVTLGVHAGKTKMPVTYTLTVKEANLIADAEDAGFEKGTNFTIVGKGISNIPAKDDPYEGSHSMHWNNASATTGGAIYNIPIELSAGSYIFEAVAQGFAKDKISVQILDENNQILHQGDAQELEGWKVWKNPSVSFTLTQPAKVKLCIVVDMQAGGWGTADCLYLHVASATAESSGESTNGSSTSTNTPTTPDQSSDSSSSDTMVTTNPDGTTTETKTETTTNESGKEVETTVTTQKDADGKVTGSTEVSTIANVAKNTEVTVTVEKGADGKVAEAAAEVTKKGAETKTGTKGTIAGAVVNQIKEAAGTADIAITTSVTDAKGNEKYSVTVNAGDLVAGEKLTVVVKDEKTGKTVLVDAKQVKVTVNGGVNVVLPEGKDYTLIDTKEAEKVTKEILKTVAPVKTSATLKEGKKATAKLSKKLDMDNVKKITYVSSKKSVATVDQNGKVTAKKAGTVIISIKVTLNNGTTKTVKMKYKVK